MQRLSDMPKTCIYCGLYVGVCVQCYTTVTVTVHYSWVPEPLRFIPCCQGLTELNALGLCVRVLSNNDVTTGAASISITLSIRSALSQLMTVAI